MTIRLRGAAALALACIPFLTTIAASWPYNPASAGPEAADSGSEMGLAQTAIEHVEHRQIAPLRRERQSLVLRSIVAGDRHSPHHGKLRRHFVQIGKGAGRGRTRAVMS